MKCLLCDNDDASSYWLTYDEITKLVPLCGDHDTLRPLWRAGLDPVDNSTLLVEEPYPDPPEAPARGTINLEMPLDGP